jgi:hypothetical protein
MRTKKKAIYVKLHVNKQLTKEQSQMADHQQTIQVNTYTKLILKNIEIVTTK